MFFLKKTIIIKSERMAIEKEELESTLGNLKMMFDQEKGKLIEVH